MAELACIGGGLTVAFRSRLTDTQFVGNTADDDRGGLWGYGTDTLNGGQFANNRCVADAGCTGGGL